MVGASHVQPVSPNVQHSIKLEPEEVLRVKDA